MPFPALIPLLGPVISKVLDKIPDHGEKEKIRLEAEKELAAIEADLIAKLAEVDKAQAEINLAEAQSDDTFKSRWRPAAGWVCVVSLALYFWPRFILGMAFWCRSAWMAQNLPPLPEMGVSDVLGLISPLLGIGGFRMVEKIKKVA